MVAKPRSKLRQGMAQQSQIYNVAHYLIHDVWRRFLLLHFRLQLATQLILVVFVMVMVVVVPPAAEAITLTIIIVTWRHPNLLADLLWPPQALAPPTVWNPSGFFDRRSGSAERRYKEWPSIRGANWCKCGAARHQTG